MTYEIQEEKSDWEEWWDARVAAMDRVLGKHEEVVGHGTIPFNLGPDMGGAADVVFYKGHIPRVISVTSELIGCDDQIRNELGNYELMICHRDKEDWGPNLISLLAHYTLEAKLSPGETMDIGAATPKGSTIAALMFFEYARFDVKGRDCGLLLLVGITADELRACHKGRHDEVVEALKSGGVYPYTDLNRKSVLKRRGWFG